MPDRAILDLRRLEEAFEDDREGIAELLEMAMDTGASHVETLNAALAGGDVTTVAKAAHSIKGSASNVGGMIVSSIAAEIETRARGGSLDGVPALVTDLDAAYAELRAEVRAYRNSLGSTT